MRILLPAALAKIEVTYQAASEPETYIWDAQSSTLLLKFRNYSEGVDVKISL